MEKESESTGSSGETEKDSTRLKGRVTSINLDKGYGFLRGEDRLSRFFLAKDISPLGIFDTLKEQQRVTFLPYKFESPDPRNNGLRAKEIELC